MTICKPRSRCIFHPACHRTWPGHLHFPWQKLSLDTASEDWCSLLKSFVSSIACIDARDAYVCGCVCICARGCVRARVPVRAHVCAHARGQVCELSPVLTTPHTCAHTGTQTLTLPSFPRYGSSRLNMTAGCRGSMSACRMYSSPSMVKPMGLFA